MSSQPRHRPRRRFPEAQRLILECPLETCPHCGQALVFQPAWHLRKTVQTLQGPLFVAGRKKRCVNPSCSHPGQSYLASQALLISLPYSTYGLDVLAFIGWQHEHEHRQLGEIHRELNRRGVQVNDRNVGKLYRQFLALLGGSHEAQRRRLAEAAQERGGVVWAVDALQPEGHGPLLYVLYEALSETVVSAVQLNRASAPELGEWLKPYQALEVPVLATLSDGEGAIRQALAECWPEAPHQRCQCHFLSNLAEPALEVDRHLRQRLADSLGGLPPVPEEAAAAPPLCPCGATRS